MSIAGLPIPKITGRGSFKPPEPQLLTSTCLVGQLVVYSNYIGVISEITNDYIKIDTKHNQYCSNLYLTSPYEYNDHVLIGKKIIID